MFTKSGIMAQEFKEQLGDRMPTAMRALEKSTGKTAKELFKMMEMGQLDLDYIVPFTKALRELSNEGGALEKALKTVRVQESRMINLSKQAADTIFKSGFSEGLSTLYKTISELLKDSGKELEKIGRIFGTVFKGVAYILKVIEPLIKAIVNNIELLVGAVMVGKIYTLTKAFSTLGVAIKGAFLPVTAALFALEEIASLFSDKLVGVTEKTMGEQFNFAEATRTKLVEKDGKFYSDTGSQKESKMPDSDFLYGPIIGLNTIGGLVKKYQNSEFAQENSKMMLNDLNQRTNRSSTSKFYTPEKSKQMVTQNNTIIVQGVTGEDVSNKILKTITEFAGTGSGR